MLRSPEVMLLFSLAGVAAWVSAFAGGPFPVLAALGFLSLIGALLSLQSRALRWTRVTSGVLGFSTLPGATAVFFLTLSGQLPDAWFPRSTRPFVDPPVASEGERVHPDWLSTTVVLLPTGKILVKGRFEKLEDLHTVQRLFVSAHKTVPWRMVGSAVRRMHDPNHDAPRVWVQKYLFQPSSSEEPALLGAEERVGWSWPWCTIRLPISIREPGSPIVFLTSEARQSRRWGKETVQAPTRARYRIGARETDDLRELARWIEQERPKGITPDDTVPFKFVIAVANKFLKVGITEFAVGPLPEPTPKELEATVFPYPIDR